LKKLKIIIITGTRPELIKLSILIRLLKNDKDISTIFIHSGQHYDNSLFEYFLDNFKLPKPDYNIQIGSLPNSIQTGHVLIDLYKIIEKEKPDLILSQGDTNTVYAAALTAFKTNIPFGHIEAGIRSFDMRMPEEINRILTGSCSLLNFAPTERAVNNLLDEGIPPNRIFKVGNPIVDVVQENFKKINSKSRIHEILDYRLDKKFILLTLHRPSNVDFQSNLRNIFESLLNIKEIYIIFPVHPRTKANLERFGLLEKLKKSNKIDVIDPVDYFDMLNLISKAYFVLTDSGGIQEESVILRKPCLTLRTNTERPESIEIGSNILTGNDPKKINYYTGELWNNNEFYSSMIPKTNPFGDGTSSQKIVDIIKNKWKKEELKLPHIDFGEIIPFTKVIQIKNEDISVKDYEIRNKCIVLEIFDNTGYHIFPITDLILKDQMIIKVRFY